MTSKDGIHVLAKWQFYNNTHLPLTFASSINVYAILPWPWPKEIIYNLDSNSRSRAYFNTIYVGSAPEDNTKIIGVAGSES